MATEIRDSEWLRQAFVLPTGGSRLAITAADRVNRTYSAALTKFTDTTPGGNFSINNPPQACRHADIKNHKLRDYLNQGVPGVDSYGMGRYFSEAYDDNSVRVHLTFGHAEYNSITQFFSNFYDPESGMMARNGESRGLSYSLGKATGWIVSAPLIPFTIAASVIRYLSGTPRTRYSYVKPNMPNYWGVVNNIANKLAINMGLVPGTFTESTTEEVYLDGKRTVTKTVPDYSGDSIDDWEAFNKILPDVYRADGGIDVYNLATRAQRLNDGFMQAVQDAQNNAASEEALSQRLAEITAGNFELSSTPKSYSNYLQSYREQAVKETKARAKRKADGTQRPVDEPTLTEQIQANLRDGAQWVSFRLDEVGTIGESFSSSVKESSISETINGISSTAKDAKASMANFNFSDGIVGSAVESVVSAVGDFTAGILDGVGLSGLAVLGGGAYADIPQIWDNSTANLPSETFTIQLRTPYGNKVSIYQNLYIPLAMLLAGALPLSTGPASYTSPFLCQCFVKGRMQSRNAIITELSITRGTSNAGWSVDGLPLGIDITFTVTDLSSVMHAPIAERTGLLDDDNAFMDYMAVLGSLGVADQWYPSMKLKRNAAYMMRDFETNFSASRMAMNASNTLPGRLLSAFHRTAAGI